MQQILNRQFRLLPEDTFTTKEFTFDVPMDAAGLRIGWSYKPRGQTDLARCAQIAEETLSRYLPDEVERQRLLQDEGEETRGLKNQLDFTLFGPQGFCGNANGRKLKVELTDDTATIGFVPGVPRGRCKILLGVYCIYSDFCEVAFAIDAWQAGEEQV